MDDQTDTTNPKGTSDKSESDAGSSAKSKDTATASATKPRSGEVTADENKRFLAEIVALHALSKASEEIADSIAEVGDGGILIINELDFAANDIFYIDMRHKLDILLKLSEKYVERCKKFAQCKEKGAAEGPEQKKEKSASPNMVKALAALPILAAVGPALTAGIPALSGLMSSAGDVIGFFRSDYEFKGQTLVTPEDIYIQAMVADRLRKANREVYLINFHALKESKLITDMNKLIEQKLKMFACAEIIKTTCIDVQTGVATALGTHVANLHEKRMESLLKVDNQVTATLRNEIDQKTKHLKEYQENRHPDSQISELESYLAGLRNKLAEEIVKDNLSSKEALDREIQKIVQKLAENEKASADKKLTEAEVKALKDQLTLYQTKLVDLVIGIGSDPKKELRREIESISEYLNEIQKGRVPTEQISALETHIASLNGKLIDSLSNNGSEVLTSLDEEIEKTTEQIEVIHKAMKEAECIVSDCTKVNDAIDSFITSITAVPAGGNYPPYLMACVREYFAEERIKFILKLKLIASGADFIIEKPPFWSTDVRTSYLGGGVVSFILAEKEGRIAASGTIDEIAALDHRIGKEPKEINWQIRPKREE